MNTTLARTTDARALATIARATFLQTYAHMIPWPDLAAHNATQNSAAYFQRALDAGDAAWLLTISDTAVPIGFALLTEPDLPVTTEPRDLELKRIYILHRFHGGGHGRQLLDAVEAEALRRSALRLLLGVYHENPTIGWYRRQGFQEAGTRDFTVGGKTFHDLILAKPVGKRMN